MSRFLKYGGVLSGMGAFIYFCLHLDLEIIRGALTSPSTLVLATLASAVRAMVGVGGLLVLFEVSTLTRGWQFIAKSLQASLINLLLPFGGFLAKARGLKVQEGVGYGESISRFTVFSGLRIFSGLSVSVSIYYASHFGNIAILGAYIFLQGSAILALKLLVRGVIKVPRFPKVPDIRGRYLGALSFFDLLTIGSSAAVILALAESFGFTLDFERALIAAAVAMAASALPVFPGGIGIRELSFAGTLSGLGLSLSWVATFVILERLLNIIGRLLALAVSSFAGRDL